MTTLDVPLSIETTGFGDHVQIHLHGDLDVATAPVVLEHVEALFETGITVLILDASELTFVDSKGLSLILNLHKQSAAGNSTLLLRGVGPQLAQLLRVAGLTDFLDRADS